MATIVAVVTIVIFVVGLVLALTNRMTEKLFLIWTALVLVGSIIWFSISCRNILWVGKIPICR